MPGRDGTFGPCVHLHLNVQFDQLTVSSCQVFAVNPAPEGQEKSYSAFKAAVRPSIQLSSSLVLADVPRAAGRGKASRPHVRQQPHIHRVWLVCVGDRFDRCWLERWRPCRHALHQQGSVFRWSAGRTGGRLPGPLRAFLVFTFRFSSLVSSYLFAGSDCNLLSLSRSISRLLKPTLYQPLSDEMYITATLRVGRERKQSKRHGYSEKQIKKSVQVLESARWSEIRRLLLLVTQGDILLGQNSKVSQYRIVCRKRKNSTRTPMILL